MTNALAHMHNALLNEDSQEYDVQDGPSFAEMLDESFMSLHTGAVVKGTVVSVTPTEVIVDLGYKSDGIISRNEFIEDPTAILTELVKPGDVFDVAVLRVNDGDGNVVVSKKKVDNQLNYKHLEAAFTDKTSLPGKVVDIVKGGLIVNIMGCRVFVPASQISNRFESDLQSFKGKEFDFNILEFDRSKRRIVGGRRELAAQELNAKKAEVFGKIQEGSHVEGTVSRIVDFGAFVDLGGVDGLIHVSEVSWKRVRKVTEVLSVGDHVKAIVLKADPEKGKISLTLRDMNTNPWNGIAEKYPIGEIVEGTVVRLAPFGAFVSLEDGIDGLVHISQIADKHVAKPEDELSPGQIIQVKVVDIDPMNQKISLSKRAVDAPEPDFDEDNDVIEESIATDIVDELSEEPVE